MSRGVALVDRASAEKSVSQPKYARIRSFDHQQHQPNGLLYAVAALYPDRNILIKGCKGGIRIFLLVVYTR